MMFLQQFIWTIINTKILIDSFALNIKLFWSGTDDNDIARKVLAYVPDDFSGNLLDVPVGTAVFTENKWSSLKKAHITCIDYSMDMLEQARKRLGSHAHSQLSGISNGTSSAIHTGSLFPTFS